ncbi:hypothetical protein [Pedobacter sp. SL55]|uniref:hypothetical protein n=1 Tax=Pedobacter sp. SL55 TaxID=2995161 RepID=UPI00226EE3E4|nr:hypothetical protein [Pedobacter sp. SL55]WAC42358.1 hypothetical protein OVA16_08385 [Pedobacter sp. SL55]
MKKNFFYLLLAFVTLNVINAKAQVYVAKVSKDSVSILTSRLEALKASQKIQELKIDEAKEEAEVEKLRVKLLEANDKAKDAADKSNKTTQKLDGGTVDAKEMEKLAKKAKNALEDSQKALDRYNKQIGVVEKIRVDIQTEERKAGYKKPAIVFVH